MKKVLVELIFLVVPLLSWGFAFISSKTDFELGLVLVLGIVLLALKHTTDRLFNLSYRIAVIEDRTATVRPDQD